MINMEKSHLKPTTEIEFLGFILNSVTMMIHLTEPKHKRILSLVENVMKSKSRKISIRHLAKIIGHLISTFPACNDGQLHYRDLECKKIRSLKTHRSWSHHIKLSELSIAQLCWWVGCLQSGCPYKSLMPVRFTISFYSDTSGEGWEL